MYRIKRMKSSRNSTMESNWNQKTQINKTPVVIARKRRETGCSFHSRFSTSRTSTTSNRLVIIWISWRMFNFQRRRSLVSLVEYIVISSPNPVGGWVFEARNQELWPQSYRWWWAAFYFLDDRTNREHDIRKVNALSFYSFYRFPLCSTRIICVFERKSPSYLVNVNISNDQALNNQRIPQFIAQASLKERYESPFRSIANRSNFDKYMKDLNLQLKQEQLQQQLQSSSINHVAYNDYNLLLLINNTMSSENVSESNETRHQLSAKKKTEFEEALRNGLSHWLNSNKLFC